MLETLNDVVDLVIMLDKPDKFKFVEIGVFKGDNALAVIDRLINKGLERDEIYYVGFDIFEDLGNYKVEFPDEYLLYDLPEYPYFEYKSGSHSYQNVYEKINSVLSKTNFQLIKGDSRETLPEHTGITADTSIVYIDGCHEYEVVKCDWLNIKKLADKNRNLVIVFDDATYDGVNRIKSEISTYDDYKIRDLNHNQFFVFSRNSEILR